MNESVWFEHRFWLQILGDHSRFIFNALAPKEMAYAQTAHQFIVSFDRLLEQARRAKPETDAVGLSEQAYQLTIELRTFKLNILQRLLVGKITISLPPTFVNHMVNELEEYLRILNEVVRGKPVPVYGALHHDMLWLSDAAGHAASIAADLDFVEKRLIEKSQLFENHFQQFYLKSIEMAGYMRTQLQDFPAFRKFHTDIDLEMKLFVTFLRELEEMGITGEVLDRLSPLIPDHMMREECYYLTKLAQLGMVPDPGCQPDQPRLEA